MNWKFWRKPDNAEGQSRLMVLIERTALAVVASYLIGCGLLAWWWDTEPALFDVGANARARAAAEGALSDGQQVVRGYTTVATLARVATTLLDKRGGFLSNDQFPPGVWMDNMPAWEFGVLVQVRDLARAMRNDFSRSQSQSAEDKDLSEAEGKFFYDNSSWLFPPSESEYRAGVKYLDSYLKRIADPKNQNTQFYARADNLRNWLAGVEMRLGSLSQRLSAAVGKQQTNIDLAGDSAARQSTAGPEKYSPLKTPWLEIDDVFYESRGYTWSLILVLHAIETDFAEVLDKKNARPSLEQIIHELEPTQQAIWSPMVLNGDGFGFLANHSLVMASYIARANAAIIDLRNLLQQG